MISLYGLYPHPQALTEEQMTTTAASLRKMCQPKFKVEDGNRGILSNYNSKVELPTKQNI